MWTCPLIFKNTVKKKSPLCSPSGFKNGHLPRIFLENMSNPTQGFKWAMKIRTSWWRIRRALRLFATHWASLMISAWPGFVSGLRALAFCSRAPGRQPTGQQQHRDSFHRHRLFSSSLLRTVRLPEHVPVLQLSGNASAQLPLALRQRRVYPKWLGRMGNFACAFYSQGELSHLYERRQSTETCGWTCRSLYKNTQRGGRTEHLT